MRGQILTIRWQNIAERNKKVKYLPLPGKGEDTRKCRSVKRFYIPGRSHAAGYEKPQKLLKFQHFGIFLEQDSACLGCYLW